MGRDGPVNLLQSSLVGKRGSPSTSEWINGLLGFVFPEVCQICRDRRARPDEGYVCGGCWSKPGAIQFIRKPFCHRCGLPFDGDLTSEFECSNCHDLKLHFTSARSSVVAARLVTEVIHRFKYQKHVWFEPFLADLLLRELEPWNRTSGHWDCLIPVPLHPQKEREREFNQSRRIAIAVSTKLNIPTVSNAVNRVRATETQTHLSRHKRAANMRKAFAITGRFPLNGKRVILIDDVFTTGATTNACARVLRKAGADEVCVWTVARGI